MFNPDAPYQYLLPTVYMFMADIATPDLYVCSCRAWICLDITRFYEEQYQPSSVTAPPIVGCVVCVCVINDIHLMAGLQGNDCIPAFQEVKGLIPID